MDNMNNMDEIKVLKEKIAYSQDRVEMANANLVHVQHCMNELFTKMREAEAYRNKLSLEYNNFMCRQPMIQNELNVAQRELEHLRATLKQLQA